MIDDWIRLLRIESCNISFDDKYIKLRLNKPACIPIDSIIILCEKSLDAFHIVAYGNFNNIDNNYEFSGLKGALPNVYYETENATLSDDSIDIDDI